MRVAEPPKTDRPTRGMAIAENQADRPTDSGHGIAENQADRPTEVRIAPAARLHVRGG